jgi:putative endonuclease
MQKKLLGRLGELISSKYLIGKNYSIIQRNFHTRYGEIDIVAREKNRGKNLVFVEVKTRNCKIDNIPESLSLKQIQKIKNSIFVFLEKKGLNPIDFRLDLIIVLLDLNLLKKRLIHYKNILEN